VKRGDVLAQVGSTGIANGPHLHYEVRLHGEPQNPMNYVIRGVIP
jgi:murein DD-endopeptidase MepM/ murein hydrolase activator NlpD